MVMLRRWWVLQAPQNIFSQVENHLHALQSVITVAVALIPETMQEVQNQYVLFCLRIESSVIGSGQSIALMPPLVAPEKHTPDSHKMCPLLSPPPSQY